MRPAIGGARVSPERFMMAQLAAFAYGEVADMGGFNPMLAVMCCLRNRLSWYNGDWGAMLNRAGDVAPHERPARTEINMGSGEFRRVLQEVDDVFNGMYIDELTGAIDSGPEKREGGVYYLDALYEEKGKTVRPWFKEKIIADPHNHPRIAQVGMLYIFS
jgi:hypothetical protein